MSITEKFSVEINSKGILIGTVEPNRESKGSWSQLFFYNDKLYSVIYSDPVDAWVVCAEEVLRDDISQYTNSPEETIKILNEINSEGLL